MKNFASILLVVSIWFAAGVWICSPTSAQNLPELTVGLGSNRLVNINWPYTNSGFAFQEATNLKSAVWQDSPLTPGFNSNSATFSVLAAATNASKFFRLAQPADLRGIYIYSSDVSSLTTNDAQTLTAALGVLGVDGLVLVISWRALEPTSHIYHWTNLDLWMNQAVALGKKVNLAVIAGNDTPQWLFDAATNGGAGATQLNFTISPHEGATSNCIPDAIAPPWDTNFLASWKNLLGVLSSHLKTTGAYSNLTLLRLTGINRTTDELRLPAETAQTTHLDCVSNAPAIWQAAGYTPSNLLSGWSNILSAFQTHFPDKNFSVAIIPQNAFPAIDDNGQIITTNIPDANQPLLGLAAQKLVGRLVVQFNFLMTGSNASPAVVQAALSYGTLTAFQSNNYFGSTGGGAACGGNVVSPLVCSNDTYLAELEEGIYPLTPTNQLRSQYIEVFPANVLALTNAIWQAHLELVTPP
jgi:Beta-galactosidase